MSIPQLTDNLNIIQALDNLPNDATGLTAAQLKAKFDEAVNIIKDYINDTLLVNLPLDYAQSTNVLTKNNTTAYTPTASYHPTTMLYVLTLVNSIIAGQINTTDPVTGKKYAIIINNGLLGIKEVA